MKDNRLNVLIKRYQNQECTVEEKEELALLIDSVDDETLKQELQDLWDNYSYNRPITEKKTSEILHNILSSEKKTNASLKSNRQLYIQYLSIAASFLLVLSIYFLFKNNSRTTNPEQRIIVEALKITPQEKANYTRNITLPDSSVVVLNAGSTLDYPTQFDGTTREVTLVGEAYFDIAHNKAKPFIIHTGKVKTIVLGTAFNIKAWPTDKNITVSVTRGKVKVEKENNTLAILTPNQQIQYNTINTNATHQNIDAQKLVSDWTQKEMVFEEVSMERIVRDLSKRFGVNITIEGKQLANTLIVSSFSGTESIRDILDILCTINANTQYKMQNKEILISAIAQ